MGRNKALDKGKKKHKKGLWSPDEDQKLRNYVLEHGHGCWTSVPINAGLQRNGKSCRLRWLNYLRPGLKRGMFSKEEEEIILNLHAKYGNKWCQIAHKLPGRTDNEIKNYWHSHLKKKVKKMAEAKEYSSSLTFKKSSFETLEDMEEPVMVDSDQSCAPKSNLPRILFAEWLTFDDQFGFDYGGSSSGVCENASENNVGSNSQHGFNMHDLLLNEGTNCSGELMLPKLNNPAGDDDGGDVFQQEFDFETLYSQNEFSQYFPAGEFNV